MSAVALASAGPPVTSAAEFQSKAHVVAKNFEAVFLNAMMQPMFSAANDGGPMGGGSANGIWRSMLTDEYAKTFAKSGGIGIADHIYRSLIAAQEGRRVS